MYQGNCYTFHSILKAVTWHWAETACQKEGEHLVSIVNKDEMIFLHYLLTTRWHKDELKTYIGKSLHADTKINSNHNVGCHKQAHGPPQDIN